MKSGCDNFLDLIFKYFHNINEYQITNKNIVYMLMSMFYLQQICHALNDFSDFFIEEFEFSLLQIITNSILLFQVDNTSDIISKSLLIYIFFGVLTFYIIANVIIFVQYEQRPDSFDSLKSFVSTFDFVNYFFLADIILNNSLKSLLCNSNSISVFLGNVDCTKLSYKLVFIFSIMNICLELIILLKYCYFCNTILMNNSFPLCRNVCQIELCVITTKIINISLRIVDSGNLWVKFTVTCFNTFLYAGISLYVLIYLPFHKQKSNYMTFYYNSFVFFFYLFILIFVLFKLKSMIIFLIVLFFVNHSLSHHIFHYRVHTLIFHKNIGSISRYYEIIFISNYFLELYENEFDHHSKAIKFGIISKHHNECTNADCPLKSKEMLYFPNTNEWSSQNKSVYEHTTFIFLIICILENFNKNHPNKFINIYLSELFLIYIGNPNKTLYYFYSFRSMEIKKLEMFHYVKLAEDIQTELVKNLKDSREAKGFSTEEIDIMQYFKITNLYENLQTYINNYLRNSDKFWKTFTEATMMILNLDKLYQIASDITKDLKTIKLIWKNLSQINSNYLPALAYYSEFLVLLGDFVELKQLDINQKKDLLIFNNQNFYSLLFNHDNIVISIRGNLQKLGEISYVSNNCEVFLNYKPKDLHLQKMEMLIPQPIAGFHNHYLKKYFEVGYHVKLNKISTVIMLKKFEDPIWATAFIKYYPALGEEILYVGVITRSELKNNLVILDSDFQIKYIASSILSDYNFDLNNYKKSKIEIPFYIICPNILKYFKIQNNFIYNKTNMDGDLNQVILDLFVPPFFEALNKEIMQMRSQSNDSILPEENSNEENKERRTTNVYGSLFSKPNMNKSIIQMYKEILLKLSHLYQLDKIEDVFDVLKELYGLRFPGVDKTIYKIKVKIEFHNYTYKDKNNIILSDIKVLTHGHTLNIEEIFIPHVELDDLCFQETSNNEQSNNIENITPNLKILDEKDSERSDISNTNMAISNNNLSNNTNNIHKTERSYDILLSKKNHNTTPGVGENEPKHDEIEEEARILIKPKPKKNIEKPKKIEIAQAPKEKDKSLAMGNTASVQSSLTSSFSSLTNSKKIINDAKDYETDSLKLAFLVTRKIFPLILISFQLFLYISSLNIITTYQIFLNFYSEKFSYYYELLALTNYLSLGDYFLKNINISSTQFNIFNNSLSANANYSNLFTINEHEHFPTYKNYLDHVYEKYYIVISLKREYDSFEWLQQNELFKIVEAEVNVSLITTFNDHIQIDEVNLSTGLINVINMINIFIRRGEYRIIHDILTNLYSSIIPKANRLLKITLSDLIDHIQSDKKTFTLVFTISIICIFTSGSLNYYTYVKIKDLAEKTFVLIKDIPVKTINFYLKSLDDFTRKNDSNQGNSQKEEAENNLSQQQNLKKSKTNKKNKFYIKKLNLIRFFFVKLVFLMISLCIFFCLNYFMMMDYMNSQQTFLEISNFLFVIVYNNTLSKIQMNEILKKTYKSQVFDNKEFYYPYDNYNLDQKFYIEGANKKNDVLNDFFNTFLIQNFCQTVNSYNVTNSHYCSNPALYNNQYEFGLQTLIDNYNQYYQSILLNTKFTSNSEILFYSEDYKQLCFYYYNFIEDQINLPIKIIADTYKSSGSAAYSNNHVIFSFFIISLFIILSYFTNYFLTKMKNVLNDCKDFIVHLPNNFFTETSSLKRFLFEMANEIKMQSNV